MRRNGRLHLRMEQALLDKARELANQRGVTMTCLVDLLLREFVARAERSHVAEELGVEQV